MLWGTFGIVHISSLILAVFLNVALYFAIKNLSEKKQIVILGLFSLLGMSAIIFNLIHWGSPLEYLPFHLCSLNALILPFAVFFKNKILGNILLLWSFGAIFALVVNHAQANFEIFSSTFFFYYFPHVFEIGIPFIMFKLKLIKKDHKCILSTLLITFASYTLIHLINVALNGYFIKNNVLDWAGNIVQVNYMFSTTPENPLLQLFYNIVPYPYWYMLLTIPIIAVYLTIMYLPQIIKRGKEN